MCGAVSLLALGVSACAVSYEDDEGRRQVIGLFSMSRDAALDRQAPTSGARHFTFYGVWFDDTFRGTSVAFGEVELSVADLRNQWRGAGEAMADAGAGDACSEEFGFRRCSLDPPDGARAGEAFDISVAGISIGVGARDRHFGIGYHRQVLLEVTNANALVTWPSSLKLLRPGVPELARRSLGAGGPAHVGLENLLRGTING